MAGQKKKGQKKRKVKKGRGELQPQPQPQPQLQSEMQPSTEVEWTEFEKELELSFQQWGKPDVKSFWLFACHVSEVTAYNYYIYAVHLNSPSDSPLKLQPILHWEMTLDHYAYAILGFTLCMFGGEDTNGNSTNNVSLHDMQTAFSSPSTTYLDEASIQSGPPMKAIKIRPLAVVIDDFRICVFSCDLCDSDENCPKFFPNFELFDTTNSTWTSLPEPLSYSSLWPDEDKYVTSYCVHGSILVISINCKGIFGINLQKSHVKYKWVKLIGSESIRSFPFYGPDDEMWTWTMVGKYMCNAFFAVKRGDLALAEDSEDLALSPLKVASSSERESLITVYQHGMLFGGAKGDGYTTLYVVRARVPSLKHTPNLLVDILKLDSTQSEWGNIQEDESLTFSLTSFSPCLRLLVLGCFPFEIGDTNAKEVVGQAGVEEKKVKNKEDEKAADGAEDDKVETELVNKPAEEAGSDGGSKGKVTETVVEKGIPANGGATDPAYEKGHQYDMKPNDGD